MVCTGLTAIACPVHGDCTCGKAGSQPFYDKPDCPLHSVESRHADNQERVKGEALISDMEAQSGKSLTEHDHRSLSWFAQLLLEKNRKGQSSDLSDPNAALERVRKARQ